MDHTKQLHTFCHARKCRRVTLWVPGRGGKFSRCSECGDRFPCAHECAHLDCKADREERKRS